MSKFQVAFIAASFGEADVLSTYINAYLCDRKYYTRDWREQCKASSFLTLWMHMTIPQMISRFKHENNGVQEIPASSNNIQGGSLDENLRRLFAILDVNQDIYNCRLSENSEELLRKLNHHNAINFGEPKRNFVKHDFLSRATFNVSVFFVISIEIFCQSGGFDLLKLALKGQDSSHAKAGKLDYTPSFHMFTQVLNLVFSLKDLLEFDFYSALVADLRDLCLDYALNRIDEDSLRSVTKKDLSLFIHHIESLLRSVVLTRNKNHEERLYEEDVYSYTEKMELEFALKCLRMPILEKKFIGHAILG